uniref:Uncharacterized protein n=1 Tax=Aegilops tauschii subsp. strangulata TaxID=200361 RepID=A0A453I344_AEGTS
SSCPNLAVAPSLNLLLLLLLHPTFLRASAPAAILLHSPSASCGLSSPCPRRCFSSCPNLSVAPSLNLLLLLLLLPRHCCCSSFLSPTAVLLLPQPPAIAFSLSL